MGPAGWATAPLSRATTSSPCSSGSSTCLVLGHTGSYWDVLGWTGMYWGWTGSYWAVLGYIGGLGAVLPHQAGQLHLCRAVWGAARAWNWVVLGWTGLYWVILGVWGLCCPINPGNCIIAVQFGEQHVPGTGLYWVILVYTGL